ncbi:FAD-binding protein [Ruficoccus amylovorans]|uniref:FAD-binding protein n=1 Tax=Ruficoccus amylovorans TaxID=1804625 RepID=A0A842HFC6_9BACT|nr:FAD-binding and (Fe-S)-binding domain-containing protein [Ruficoccus amylovorans]MBC2595335.1 FAD-binding protein [Ruficoccus amylovorans]
MPSALTQPAPVLGELKQQLTGELHTSPVMRKLYATDASEYQEFPQAVAFPADEADIATLIRFAARHRVGLIPRTAGTSLAGQVVGGGIVVDVGRRLNQILSLDAASRRVRVQPGVVRNELNHFLQPHGLLYGPETSTANRAMIGGMVGNNSCGSNSVVYGSAREHLVSCRGFLSDGTEVTFGPLDQEGLEQKCAGPEDSLEAKIYRFCRDLLGDKNNRELIAKNFPKSSIPRRNTGYALDLLMDARVFDPASEQPFNLCRLIAGSEGTLFFGVEFELDLNRLPPAHSALLCAHFADVDQSLRAVLHALPHQPFAVELLDRHILEATKRNIEQAKNRFFVQGDPGAILVVDIRHDDEAEVDRRLAEIVVALKADGLGYHFPILKGPDQARIWELRRAGQGLMSNVPGDAKPREIVEDTAVDVHDLPAYIAEFDTLMREKYHIECVYYAHAGSGELHTRPMFNLKTAEGLKTFRGVAEDIAALVKKYNGSLSGEHGDGRLRGEFIPFMVGEECFAMMRRVKETFDPLGIFNPGKIIDTPPMDTALRVSPDEETPQYDTFFDFSSTLGVLRAAEQCNGSGDCRKGHLAGGTMCPSYMATREEKHTTRARANILRHTLTHPRDALKPFDSGEVKEVMDLCLSCKACKSECPSNVDIAKLKAEFLQHYYDEHGVPLRSRMIANYTLFNKLVDVAPWAWNLLFGTAPIRRLLNRVNGFHPDRTIPLRHRTTLTRWFKKQPAQAAPKRKVYLFCDEFTEYNDVPVGQKAIKLLQRLGYEVVIPRHRESARTWLSKGLVRKASQIAEANVRLLAPLVTGETPLVGIEPSGILGFRDEYPDLVPGELKPAARALAKNCLLFSEFIEREIDAGRISADAFTDEPKSIHLHGHCFQKSLASITPSVRALSLPGNYTVTVIPSGCCGMAGSFGYEKEHYEVSMKVGELVLFPTVRKLPADTLVAAPGTSCRHQIHDGTGRTALHPAEILYDALKPG